MTVRTYKSTDASAPVLSGVVGSLVALLDACLVNGYGSKTGAGWTKPFTGTNRAAFRNSASTGTGFYCDVNDAAPAIANEARMIGFEAMTAVGTGTNPFPSTAQRSTGLIIHKSATADSTPRPWVIVADETVFYLFIESGDLYYNSPTHTTAFMFGDIYSYKASDPYRCMIMGRINENAPYYVEQGETVATLTPTGAGLMSGTLAGHYMARSVTGVGSSLAVGKHTDAFAGYTTANVIGYDTGVANFPYPNAADGGLYLAPAYIHHNGGMRGYLKGLWCPLHCGGSLSHMDTFAGTGTMSAKTFLGISAFHSSTTPGGLLILETSDTWS